MATPSDFNSFKPSQQSSQPCSLSNNTLETIDTLRQDAQQDRRSAIAEKSPLLELPPALLALALKGQEPPRPGALNLTPCTIDQYVQLRDSIEDQYELVDGLLLWREMPDRNHLDIQACLNMRILQGHSRRDFQVELYIEPSVNFVNPCYAPDDYGSSSSSAGTERDSRIADVAIGDYIDKEIRHDLSPNSKKNPFSIKRLPRVIIEITSEGNRKNDIKDKWRQYANYNIPEYYIVDRKKQCVVYGYFGEGKETPRLTGDCDDFDKINPEWAKGKRIYCRRVFRGDDIIKGEFLGKLKMKVREVLEPAHVGDWLQKLNEQRARTLRETEKERDYLKTERNKAMTRIDEVSSELDKKCRDVDKKARVIRNLANDLENAGKKIETLSTEKKKDKQKIEALKTKLEELSKRYGDPQLLACIREQQEKTC